MGDSVKQGFGIGCGFVVALIVVPIALVIGSFLVCGGCIAGIGGLTVVGGANAKLNEAKARVATQNAAAASPEPNSTAAGTPSAEEIAKAKQIKEQEAKRQAIADTEAKKKAEHEAKLKAADADEPQAAYWLKKAKQKLEDGDQADAKARLQRIVKDFPGTSAAEEAQRLLDGMR